mmetsp:Transcript_42813/g.80295  ORF Transcript_42813/g.80295 Transcript_42813/m.80295 type:complete len:912 (+) Transcript_42813:158-2893(+)
MPLCIRLARFLLSCWAAGSLLASAWRGDDSEEEGNASAAQASVLKPKGYDVFSAAHDSLLQARQASFIQQHAGLLATRDSLLHSLKDLKPVGTNATGAKTPVGTNSTDAQTPGAHTPGKGNTTITLPYSSFVSPAPSVAVNKSTQKHNPETSALRDAVDISAPQTSTETVPTALQNDPSNPTAEENVALEASAQDRQQKEQEKSAAMNWVGKDFSGYFNEVKYTVIRIQAITEEVNWFEPYQQPQDMQFIGSGFAIYTDEDCHDDPIFITNAHVVRDAHNVQVQLPALGQLFFDAFVPLICEDFDLAIVQLVKPKEFLAALKGEANNLDASKVHGKLQSLLVEDWPLVLGLEVASVGFPLGSTSLKLSRGVISGTEEVGNFICYQTTAPISPGSSGGPLFALNENNKLQVIGATFASAASYGAQNTNYVVPTVSIIQVINEFKRLKGLPKASLDVQGSEDQPSAGMNKDNGLQFMPVRTARTWVDQMTNSKKFDHKQFRVAPVDSEGVEANEALYKSEGCTGGVGVYLSKILDTSIFKHAEPEPIPERCFLTKVGDIPLDNFGMGRTDSFLGDPTPFESLLMEKAKEANMIPITVCKGNASKEYKVNMTWNDEWYEMGVKDVREPHFERQAMEYEIFAGVTFMQMSVQHIYKLLRWGESPTLGRWLLPENQKQERLIVTHVQEGTYASRVLAAGMVVDKVNGKEVHNIPELRAAFEPPDSQDYWELVTDRNVVFVTNFQEALVTQMTMAESGLIYLATKMVTDAVAKIEKQIQSQGPIPQPQMNRSLPNNGNTGMPVSISIQFRNAISKTDSQGGAVGNDPEIPYGVSRGMMIQKKGILAHADAAERVTRFSKGRSLMMTPGTYTGDGALDSSREKPDLEARRQARVARTGLTALSGVSRHGFSSLAETPL